MPLYATLNDLSSSQTSPTTYDVTFIAPVYPTCNSSSSTVIDVAFNHLFDSLCTLQRIVTHQNQRINHLEQILQLKNTIIEDLHVQLKTLSSTITAYWSVSTIDLEPILYKESLHTTTEHLLINILNELQDKNHLISSL